MRTGKMDVGSLRSAFVKSVIGVSGPGLKGTVGHPGQVLRRQANGKVQAQGLGELLLEVGAKGIFRLPGVPVRRRSSRSSS